MNTLDLTWFAQSLENVSLMQKLKNMKLLISDIDGSLTDGTVGYTEEKEDSRRFSIQDGFGIIKTMEAGLLVGFLSGKSHLSAQLRARKLGIPEQLCFGGKEDKLTVITAIQQEYKVTPEQTLLFGDDYLDALVKVKAPNIFYAAPSNAPFYLQHIADLIIPRTGGDHSFRLLLDLILYVQKKHFAQDLIDTALTQKKVHVF